MAWAGVSDKDGARKKIASLMDDSPSYRALKQKYPPLYRIGKQ